MSKGAREIFETFVFVLVIVTGAKHGFLHLERLFRTATFPKRTQSFMDVPLKVKCQNAKVFIRIYPSEKINWDFVKIGRDKKSVRCRCLQDFGRGRDPNMLHNYFSFTTDGVFYNSSQKEIYSTVMHDVIER